jgi:pyruvate oxidase
MIVSDRIVEILTSIGDRHVLGIPGVTIDSLMQTTRRQDKIEFIVMRHEEVAAVPACGHARVTGRPGVCVARQGPGANHLLDGLADAAGDRLPVPALTGQVESDRVGTGLARVSRQIRLFDDFCVYNQQVRSTENFVLTMHLAFTPSSPRSRAGSPRPPTTGSRSPRRRRGFTCMPEVPGAPWAASRSTS